ncbi:unnamed protein product [Prunus brigantina]
MWKRQKVVRILDSERWNRAKLPAFCLLLVHLLCNGLHHFSPAEIEVSEILLEMATLIYECSNQNMKHGKGRDQAEPSMVHDHGRRHHPTADVDVINTNRVVFDIIPDLNVPLSLEEE